MSNNLPPLWYSKLSRLMLRFRGLILLAIYILIFFVWPFFRDPEPLDHQLLIGITID